MVNFDFIRNVHETENFSNNIFSMETLHLQNRVNKDLGELCIKLYLSTLPNNRKQFSPFSQMQYILLYRTQILVSLPFLSVNLIRPPRDHRPPPQPRVSRPVKDSSGSDTAPPRPQRRVPGCQKGPTAVTSIRSAIISFLFLVALPSNALCLRARSLRNTASLCLAPLYDKRLLFTG